MKVPIIIVGLKFRTTVAILALSLTFIYIMTHLSNSVDKVDQWKAIKIHWNTGSLPPPYFYSIEIYLEQTGEEMAQGTFNRSRVGKSSGTFPLEKTFEFKRNEWKSTSEEISRMIAKLQSTRNEPGLPLMGAQKLSVEIDPIHPKPNDDEGVNAIRVLDNEQRDDWMKLIKDITDLTESAA